MEGLSWEKDFVKNLLYFFRRGGGIIKKQKPIPVSRIEHFRWNIMQKVWFREFRSVELFIVRHYSCEIFWKFWKNVDFGQHFFYYSLVYKCYSMLVEWEIHNFKLRTIYILKILTKKVVSQSFRPFKTFEEIAAEIW